jgi:ubiquinone/menaquinone biosynthesis C-methylase UbiE
MEKNSINRIAFVIMYYAFEVSPTIKELIRYFKDYNYKVDIITEKLYRDENFIMEDVEIFTLNSLDGLDYAAFMNKYKYIFAVDYLSLEFLNNYPQLSSEIVYLSLESTQFILKKEKSISKQLLEKCQFGIIQSKEREQDFLKHFNNQLSLQFEYLPVSLRPINNYQKMSMNKIIYSGYLCEWSGIIEFLNLLSASKFNNFFEFTIQGHSMGTESYVHDIKEKIIKSGNIKLDVDYYSDEDHNCLLSAHNIGLAFYKTLDEGANWNNLLFSSGKIASYLWNGCAVITNIDHELTRNPPFILVKNLTDISSLNKGLNAFISNPQLYYDESLKLADKFYNMDLYAKKILTRLERWEKKTPISQINNDVSQDLSVNSISNGSQLLKLHLGCGEQYMEGYINIDYPSSEHNVMKIKPDIFADITKLDYPAGSVDEIRLHHVFEHFNRVTALAMLIKWQTWLKTGGILHIETPDLVGCAKILTSNASLKTKMGIVRHLAGDQAAHWAYHVDHWFGERFEKTLLAFGFKNIKIKNWSWDHEPYLANVEVIAEKNTSYPIDKLLIIADFLLWDSTVAEVEKPTYLVWKEQLRKVLNGSNIYGNENENVIDQKINEDVKIELPKVNNSIPISEIYNFNQNDRDRWMKSKAMSVTPGSKVLDVGAGTCPYRPLFNHCDYKAQDFKKYDGVKLNNAHEYGQIDYASDITNIPVGSGSFDVIVCTEVLEHVPEPIKALKEISRILKVGGRLLLTAPLGSGLHQLPYHYYGGFTPEWYKKYCTQFELEIKEIVPNGGFFKHLAQESARVAWTFEEHKQFHTEKADEIKYLFGDWIPRYLYQLDSKHLIDGFTIGFNVEAIKKSTNKLS